MQARIQQMQEQVNAAQEAVEARSSPPAWEAAWWRPRSTAKGSAGRYHQTGRPWTREDVEMLQDLVVSAVNEALRQAGEAMDKSIEQATGGLDLGAFGL